jgi:hypothetical protein
LSSNLNARGRDTPYSEAKKRIRFAVIVLVASCLIGISVLLLNDSFGIFPDGFVEMSVIGLMFLVALPFAFLQIAKCRCPRCKTVLLGEIDSARNIQYSWRIARVCPVCGLDQTREY